MFFLIFFILLVGFIKVMRTAVAASELIIFFHGMCMSVGTMATAEFFYAIKFICSIAEFTSSITTRK